MNYIIQDGQNFIAITNQIDAMDHKHWMLQFFLTIEEETEIKINGKSISGNAILVNMNTTHLFQSKGKYHYTVLIDPTTALGRVASELLDDQDYYKFPVEEVIQMQNQFHILLTARDPDDVIFHARKVIRPMIHNNIRPFDERIMSTLDFMKDCICEEFYHELSYLAGRVYLSESRLAHLFKEQTGIPLKSYIVLHKLQKAYELIYQGENMTTAAINAGFYSPSHFASTQKMMTGMSASNILKHSEFLKVT